MGGSTASDWLASVEPPPGDIGRSEERFPGAFDQSPLGGLILDGGLRILQSNLAIQRLLGRRADELIGQDALAFAHPEDREEVRREVVRLFTGDVDEFQLADALPAGVGRGGERSPDRFVGARRGGQPPLRDRPGRGHHGRGRGVLGDRARAGPPDEGAGSRRPRRLGAGSGHRCLHHVGPRRVGVRRPGGPVRPRLHGLPGAGRRRRPASVPGRPASPGRVVRRGLPRRRRRRDHLAAQPGACGRRCQRSHRGPPGHDDRCHRHPRGGGRSRGGVPADGRGRLRRLRRGRWPGPDHRLEPGRGADVRLAGGGGARRADGRSRLRGRGPALLPGPDRSAERVGGRPASRRPLRAAGPAPRRHGVPGRALLGGRHVTGPAPHAGASCGTSPSAGPTSGTGPTGSGSTR